MFTSYSSLQIPNISCINALTENSAHVPCVIQSLLDYFEIPLEVRVNECQKNKVGLADGSSGRKEK